MLKIDAAKALGDSARPRGNPRNGNRSQGRELMPVHERLVNHSGHSPEPVFESFERKPIESGRSSSLSRQ